MAIPENSSGRANRFRDPDRSRYFSISPYATDFPRGYRPSCTNRSTPTDIIKYGRILFSLMKVYTIIPLILVAVALIAAAGCISNPITANTSGGGDLSQYSGPVQSLPPGKNVEVQVNDKDPIYATVTTIFAGGEGQIAVKSIEVVLIRSDGQILKESLQPEKGAEVKIQGTRGTDRIVVYVSLNTGDTYKVIDQPVLFRVGS